MLDEQQFGLSNPKNQSIEQYLNQNLQLKTLKMKQYGFEKGFTHDAKSLKLLNTTFTNRQAFRRISNFQETQQYWQPKLSHRKLMNDPKVLLSVQKRKLKSSQSSKQAHNSLLVPKEMRLGFKGQKKTNHSFNISFTQQKLPKKFQLSQNPQKQVINHKKVPYFQFNYKYILQNRKIQKNSTIEQQTKTGTNKGYFACFTSQNFTKQLQKNLSRPNTENARRFGGNRIKGTAPHKNIQILDI